MSEIHNENSTQTVHPVNDTKGRQKTFLEAMAKKKSTPPQTTTRTYYPEVTCPGTHENVWIGSGMVVADASQLSRSGS